MREELEAMRRALVIQGYAKRTVQTYLDHLKRYLSFEKKAVSEVVPRDIQVWQYHLVNEKKVSWPVVFIPHMKAKKQLPSVLSQDEVSKMISVCRYPKHHAIMTTLYSTGLRLPELLALRVQDIDSTRMVIWVRGGKGSKNRQVQLSQDLLEILRSYWRSCVQKPRHLLFPGAKEGAPLDPSGVQRMITCAKLKAGIEKPVSPHTFRHCFATHLLEAGTDGDQYGVL